MAQHAFLPAYGPARTARSLHPSLRQRRVCRPLHHRRVRGQVIPDPTVRRGRATSSTTTTRPKRRRIASRTAAATRRAMCRCRSSPRRTRTSSPRGHRRNGAGDQRIERCDVSRVRSPSSSTSAQFIRHVATEVFLADQDGIVGDWGMNNFFMYRPPVLESVQIDRVGQESGLRGWDRRIPSGTTSPTSPTRTATG